MSRKNAGFSLAEVAVVFSIMLILTAIAIPNVNVMLRSYRAVSDARGIAAQLSLARMRAASEDKPAQLNFNLAANSYQMEICTSVPASLCRQNGATYAPEGGTQYLSQGVKFGFGGVIIPAGGQTAIAQTPQIIFNSRGICVDAFGNPIGTAAIYITDSFGAYYAVTVSIGGQATAQKLASAAWRPL